MSFKKKKNSDPIDFNAYGLKPTGYYLDSLKDLSRDLDRMEQNYSDADTLLSCIKEAEAAADQLIRETAEAIELSERILKIPIFAVFFKCVPPQSSIDLSPIVTTLTVSPYFSPKSAVAPIFFA